MEKIMSVKVYTTSFCPFCIAAKRLLAEKGVTFEEIDVSAGNQKGELVSQTGLRTVPQIFIDDKLIGGFEELRALEEKGELDCLLTAGD